MPNIAVLTGYTPDYGWGLFDEQGRQDYCKQHGYDYICEHDVDPSRPPHWSKVKWLLKYLPNYEWMLWLDADTLIEKPETRLESFIEAAGDKDIIITRERDIKDYNAGIYMIRNSAWSFGFLNRMWEREDLIFANWFDQAALHEEIDPTHVHEVEQWRLNAYSGMPCGFIRHFPGPYKKKYFAARLGRLRSDSPSRRPPN